MTLIDAITAQARRLDHAGVAFGQGTLGAFDEAAWLVLWRLGLPLDTDLGPDGADGGRVLTPEQLRDIGALIEQRIATRQPAAYLTRQAWLQGLPFYVDERVIIPRSFIAELLVDGSIDPWLGEHTQRVLDLCTGNGSLAVIAALTYPDTQVTGADISPDALQVARINVGQHHLDARIALVESDGLAALPGPFDLVLCNPPYVNAASMAALPAEFRAEPALALDGNTAGSTDGMDFVRALLRELPGRLAPRGVLVLEIGHERSHFEAAFPHLAPVWLDTSAGEDQVLLLTREDLVNAPG
ncbi:50S ribosomal protein L3 N(5)-glutamine methyltransferase [Comamonas serinivorans]|uniref:50S ribosomal protein L3 N(5)-glutamine methyltransferase n=1 Tax=Comamonas serinivorans TaxID=1082851 RepID=A0A1Y0EMJ8_9BURK|nr:50S ribosomal protein L3 N(5)-glutamine methyltransferase [Comamonas serinivorans]ARU04681.1 50S ribosomal protein L3 N(5)-glutamine methyltransferase [Comamonas serinivorans]